jgi:hypothetical protein
VLHKRPDQFEPKAVVPVKFKIFGQSDPVIVNGYPDMAIFLYRRHLNVPVFSPDEGMFIRI